MSGTGKRGDQKKTLIINQYGNDYFGKDKTLRRGRQTKTPSITVRSIAESIHSLVKRGIAKQDKSGYTVDMSRFKIIGSDKIAVALKITAKSATEGAKEAVANAGGEITLKE
jgi:ribosomal protein L15